MNVYDRAAALLKREGWTQGAARGPLGQRCLGQAIYFEIVGTDTTTDWGAAHRAMDAITWLSVNILPTDNGVPWWNDEPGRTLTEVFEVLGRASKQWDAEQKAARTAKLELARTSLAVLNSQAVLELVHAMTGIKVVASAPTMPDPDPEPEPSDPQPAEPELVGV